MADSASTPNGVLSEPNSDGVLLASWGTVGGLATSEPIAVAYSPDKTFVATGTWGAATLKLEGSNDLTTWRTCKDVDAADVSFTADGHAVVRDNFLYNRVKTTGGTGTAVKATMTMKRMRS